MAKEDVLNRMLEFDDSDELAWILSLRESNDCSVAADHIKGLWKIATEMRAEIRKLRKDRAILRLEMRKVHPEKA